MNILALRSGLVLKHNGIDIGAGVVDYDDYRGNVGVILFN
jgi:dUTPase